MEQSKNERKGFFVYRIFEDNLKFLDDKERLMLYDAIFAYGLHETEPDFNGNKLLSLCWLNVCDMLRRDWQRFRNGCANDGSKEKQKPKKPTTTPSARTLTPPILGTFPKKDNDIQHRKQEFINKANALKGSVSADDFLAFCQKWTTLEHNGKMMFENVPNFDIKEHLQPF